MAPPTASIVAVYNRVMGLAKSGTSGMETQDEFNGIISSVQKTLQQLLIDADEANQKVTEALKWIKPSITTVTGAGGLITIPDDYLQLVSIALVQNATSYPAEKLPVNQVEMTRTSPIRKPVLANNQLKYYFKDGAPYTMPEQSGITVRMIYHKIVPDATITLTPVSDVDSDFMEPTAGVDFGWPVSMFNILVYMTLEQYGIEVKEDLLLEYSQLGITRELIKPTA